MCPSIRSARLPGTTPCPGSGPAWVSCIVITPFLRVVGDLARPSVHLLVGRRGGEPIRPEGRPGPLRKWAPVGHAPVLSQHSRSDSLKNEVPPQTEHGSGQAPVSIQRPI